MKITCQSCQAKYTIADEKVSGKTVKIKCKKCGATIVVNGTEAAGASPGPIAGPGPGPAAAPPGGDDDEGEGATRVFAEGQGPTGLDEWTVNVTDDDQRTLTTPQIVIEYQRGVVNADTYVWKEGMTDWSPLSGVPELMRLVGGAAPPPAAGGYAAPPPAAGAPAMAPAPAPAPEPAPFYGGAPQGGYGAPAGGYGAPAGGLGGTMMMSEQPSPVAALSPSAALASVGSPTAARRAVKPNPGIDLFATGTNPEPSLAPGGSPSAAALDRLVGERNENSVLFSISALTAAAAAQRKGGGGEVASFDLGPSPGARNGGRGGMDDLINLGGGMAQGPVLAPPPLLTPYVEPPPPPPQPQPQMAPAPMQQQSPGQGGGYVNPAFPNNPAFAAGVLPDYQPKKSSKGAILGVVAAAVVLLGGVTVFFVTRGHGDKPTTLEQAAGDTTAATTGAAAPTTAPTPTQAATPPPADTPIAANTGTPAQPTPDKPTPAVGNPGRPGPGPGRPAPEKPEKPEKPAPPPPPDKPAPPPDKPATTPPADQGGNGKDFDRGAASAALSGAAGAARGCKTADGPTGSAHVRITFSPSGSVSSVTVDAPFSGTSVGSCITSAFRGAHVPAFDGSSVVVPKTISIN